METKGKVLIYLFLSALLLIAFAWKQQVRYKQVMESSISYQIIAEGNLEKFESNTVYGETTGGASWQHSNAEIQVADKIYKPQNVSELGQKDEGRYTYIISYTLGKKVGYLAFFFIPEEMHIKEMLVIQPFYTKMTWIAAFVVLAICVVLNLSICYDKVKLKNIKQTRV